MISVIIPIYNAEPYLRRCLDSVLCSTCRDFELILINDGSTDGSPAICEEYAARDSRVRLISQENQGVSAARNRGLDVCCGEWVVFVDADDQISPEFLGLISREEYRDQDLLLFDFARAEGKSAAPAMAEQHFGPKDVPKLLRCLLRRQQLTEGGNLNLLSPCGKAYRRMILAQHAIRFVPGLSYGEDQVFNVEYLTRIAQCVYLPVPVYKYNIYPESSSHRFDPDRMYRLEQMLIGIEAALSKGKYLSLLEDDFMVLAQSFLSQFLWLLAFSPFNPAAFREKCQLCRKVRNMNLFKRVLTYRRAGGASAQRWTERIMFFLFRIQQYGVISLIARFNHAMLMKTKPEEMNEMRDSEWFP